MSRIENLIKTDKIVGQDVKIVVSNLQERIGDLLEGKRILISGAAGFLGSWYTDILYALGAEIVGIDNLSTGLLENLKHLLNTPRFHFEQCDVTKYEWDGTKYDYVLHLAARPSPDDYIKHPVETLLVSSEGTLRMLEIARCCDATFLYTSTSEVYGSPGVIPTPEEYWGYVNPIGLRSCYDEGKRYAEALCMAYLRQYGLDVRISRIFNTYGPRLDWSMPGYGRVIVKFILQALKNQSITIYGDGLQTRSFCYVADNTEAHILLLTNPKAKGEIVNIGNDQEITILDLAKTIKQLTNSKSELVFKPPRPDDPRRRKPNITKAKQLLQWQPRTTLKEGLQKTINWIKTKINKQP